MTLAYKIIIGIIIFEFSLVIFIALLGSFLKIFYLFINFRKKKLFDNVDHYLKKIALSDEKFVPKHFPKRWRQLNCLLEVIKKLDAELSPTHWQTIRLQFIHKIILPLARKSVSSRRWKWRFYASEAFDLAYEKKDEASIVKLVNDDVPIIYLHAVTAAIDYGSRATINAVINRMARKRWITKSTFLQAFDNAPNSIQILVEKRLTKSKIINIRTACYTILMRFPPKQIKWDILRDIDSEDLDLRLAAIKFAAYTDPQLAIPILLRLLHDPMWEVRLVSVHRLGMLKPPGAIKAITDCLNDSEWWIRISAAEALKNYDEKGEAILQSYAPKLERIPFDITKHITNTWW